MNAVTLYRQLAYMRLSVARFYRDGGNADLASCNLAAARFWRRSALEQKLAESGRLQQHRRRGGCTAPCRDTVCRGSLRRCRWTREPLR